MLNSNYDICIDVGSILLLSHELSQGARDDVLDSTLYMQLAATATRPSLGEYEQWWELYRSQFNQFGWTRLQDFGGSFEPDSELPCLTISKMLASKVSRYLSNTYIEAIDRALIELSRLPPHSAARALLRQYSVAEDQASSLTRVRLQVGIALEGTRLIYLTGSITTRETLPNSIIEHIFRTNDIVGDVEFNGCISVLDPMAFEPWRKRIAIAVAATREDLIKTVRSPTPNK
ncbi:MULTISPECIES: hypothetical protein [Pseudomonas]|nr:MULTISPECIES: hypothetical protein [Pseudomonas]ATE80632.1 hypothetical protein CNN82_27065 [Pseudomonas frederiksbergensis]NMN79448.1 hypothetical protein [Pseudomonas sp. KD5]CAH0308879.1 hypothetical protein SRABI123_04856 [Pseudomonas sp. Bi123]